MIGYGLADSEVISIDRRASDELLAFALKTGEADLIGNLGTTDALAVVSYSPTTDTYLWFKTVSNVNLSSLNPSWSAYEANAHVYFTKDGARVLLSFYSSTVNTVALMFFDANTGGMIGTTAMYQVTPWGINYGRDFLTMNSNGSEVYYVHQRNGDKTATLFHYGFDGSNWIDRHDYTWYLDDSVSVSDQRLSILMSDDETRIFTFSSNQQSNGQKRMDCRLDVWSSADISVPLYEKGERTIQSRRCRFPAFHQPTADPNGAVYVITLLTEYFSTNKSGFMKIKLNSGYTEQIGTDQEIVFTGYTMRFTSAYYPSQDVAYAMAVDTSDSRNYLVQYEWADPNKAPDLFPLRGFSEDPTTVSYTGNPHIASIIFAEQSANYDFPVKGYITGGAKSIWAYNDCLAPDFGVTTESYEKLFTSPNSNAKLGIISKVHLDVYSCNHEHLNPITSIVGAFGQGINDKNEELVQKAGPITSTTMSPVVNDLSAASSSGVALGAWEASLPLSACQLQSADDTYYSFIEAIFEGDDIIEYEVGSGEYLVPFTDWFVNGGTCTINMVYDTRVFVAGTATADLSVTTVPDYTNLNVGIQSTDLSIVGTDYTVTVQARTPSYQCMQKDFTVKPYTCTQTVITGAFWLSSSNPSQFIDYTIGSVHPTEQIKFTSSLGSCTFEVLIYEKDSAGNWVSHPQTTTVLTQVKNTATLLPGQNIHDVTISTSDLSLDPGSGFTGLTKNYKISVASPNHVEANSSTNPKEFFLDITFRNECRDIVVQPQALPMLQNVILSGSTQTLTVPDFSFSPSLACGTQTISVFEDGTSSVPYSSFLSTSGMDISLYSDEPSHAGDYYVKVQVTFSAFPTVYMNTYDLLVRLKPSCRDDTFSPAVWLTSGSSTVPAYDHRISFDVDVHEYTPTVVNNLSAYCTMTSKLQQESGGSWSDYTGSLVILNSAAQQLSITTTAADFGLDQSTMHFRVVYSSVDLSLASSPFTLELYVKFVHPCHTAVFSDNGGVPSPLENVAYAAPHPSPLTQAVANFPYDIQTTVDCGSQTISIVNQAITPGSMSDFISIALDTGTWTLTVEPINLAQEGFTFTLQLQVQLDTYPSVQYTSPTSFDVVVKENCISGTVDNFKWTSNASMVLPEQTVYLNGMLVSEAFTAASSLDHCTLVYEFLVLDATTGTYSAYSASDVNFDSALQLVEISSSDLTLDLTTQAFQLRAATFDGVAAVGAYSEISFDIYWMSECWILTPTFDPPYPDLETYVFGPSVGSDAPTMINDPFPSSICGAYSLELKWPVLDRSRRFTTWDAATGAISVTSVEILDANVYAFTVTATLVQYPVVTAESSFKVTIGPCRLAGISPPLAPVANIIHVIGSYKSTASFQRFVQTPQCEENLTYLLQDSEGKLLDADLQIELLTGLDNNLIIVQTENLSLEGTYQLQIQAQSISGISSSPTYTFNVILAPPEVFSTGNTPPIFKATEGSTQTGQNLAQVTLPAQGGSFEFKLPEVYDLEGDKVKVSVFLNEAADFLDYDSLTGTFSQSHSNMPITPGEYTVRVILSDDSDKGSRANEYTLTFTVPAGPISDGGSPLVVYQGRDGDSTALQFLTPEILTIDPFGLVTLSFDQAIQRPSNETWFEEELRKEIYVEEWVTGEIIKTPSFEVELVPSYMHEEAIEYSWSYVGWANDYEFQFQLLFGEQTVLISMEDPADFLNITFWSQDLFISQSGLFVTRQLELTKQIQPQVVDDDYARTIETLGQIFQVSIMAGGATSLLLSLLMKFGLHWLWVLLHSVQLIIHLPIFSVLFPGYANLLYSNLIMIATFDFIETEGFVPFWFDLNPDEGPYSLEFGRLNYESQNFLMNLGFILVVFSIVALLVPITLILKACSIKSATVRKFSEYLSNLLYWNFIIRMFLELCLELSIIALMDLAVHNWSASWGYILSSSIAGVMLLALILLILFVRCWVRPNYAKIKEPANQRRFGTLYSQLNLKSKSEALSFTEWFIARRILYSAAAFFALSQTWLQFQVLFNTALFSLWIIGTIRPFESPYVLGIEFTNEYFFILILYHLVCFTDIVPDTRTRSDVGVSCVVFTFAIIAINLVVMLGNISQAIKLQIKRHIARQKFKKLLKQRERERQVALLKLPDVSELEKKIVQVEVKAKKTLYLHSQGKVQNLARAPLDGFGQSIQLDNAANQLLASPLQLKSKQDVRESREDDATAKQDLSQLSHLLAPKSTGVYRGFNVDLQMFPQNAEAANDYGQPFRNLNKVFYGGDYVSSQSQNQPSTVNQFSQGTEMEDTYQLGAKRQSTTATQQSSQQLGKTIMLETKKQVRFLF